MNDQSTSASASNEELLRLFWKQLDYEGASDEGTLSQQEAARRIVAAAGPTSEAVLLAAAFADEFRLALPTLADALEHPSEETLLVTSLRPTGSMLVAATAVRQGQLRTRAIFEGLSTSFGGRHISSTHAASSRQRVSP